MLITSGWWLSHPSEIYDFVSWDDEIHNLTFNVLDYQVVLYKAVAEVSK